MRMLRTTLSVLLLVAAITWTTPVGAQERQPATVVGVVDGDTIKVQTATGSTTTVRLTEIDTPETKHPSKPVQCFGVEASARTAELLPIGTTVELERDVQEQDRYGRTLSYVWTADGASMINEQLVREGYALTLTIPPNVKYAETFRDAQQSARDNVTGLWDGCVAGPQEPGDDALIADEPAPARPTATSAPAPKPQAAPAASGNCHPSYPDFCIPPAPPDLNCTSPLIAGRKNFTVRQPDPHRFDADKDGIGCESSR